MTAITLTLASPPAAFALILVLQRIEARLLPAPDADDPPAPAP